MALEPHGDSLPSTNGLDKTGALSIEEYFYNVGILGRLESELLRSFKPQILSYTSIFVQKCRG